MGFVKSATTTLILAIALANLPALLKTKLEVPYPQGFVKPGWKRVEKAFR